MSAVLQSPSLPMLINLEDLNAYIQNQIEKALFWFLRLFP
jgi:hypothetical protein